MYASIRESNWRLLLRLIRFCVDVQLSLPLAMNLVPLYDQLMCHGTGQTTSALQRECLLSGVQRTLTAEMALPQLTLGV
jgi:hypothetical protein